MEAIKALNKGSEPVNFKSFKNLEPGDYIARKFMIVKSRYGKRLKVYIDDYFIYLPERHAIELNDELLDVLNNNLVMLKYSGKDPKNGNRLLIDFELLTIDKDNEMVTVSANDQVEKNDKQ